jgi:hypothetical protein
MRTIPTFNISLVTLALLTGTVATVAAQSAAPPDPTVAVVVTGSNVSQSFVTPGTTTMTDGVTHIRGWSNAAVWEASDPRLSGQVTFVMNRDEYPGRDGIGVETGTRRLVNDGGSWSGISISTAGAGLPSKDYMLLAGEGAYTGLTASLVMDSEPPYAFEGAIFPGSMPEAPTAP